MDMSHGGFYIPLVFLFFLGFFALLTLAGGLEFVFGLPVFSWRPANDASEFAESVLCLFTPTTEATSVPVVPSEISASVTSTAAAAAAADFTDFFLAIIDKT